MLSFRSVSLKSRPATAAKVAIISTLLSISLEIVPGLIVGFLIESGAGDQVGDIPDVFGEWILGEVLVGDLDGGIGFAGGESAVNPEAMRGLSDGLVLIVARPFENEPGFEGPAGGEKALAAAEQQGVCVVLRFFERGELASGVGDDGGVEFFP